jgi:ceramide glucosyltransferase
MTARQVWLHQVRWARTIRVCNPAQYFFSIIGNATLWTTMFAIFVSSPASKIFAMSYASANYAFSFAITWAGLLMLGTYFTRITSALLLQKRLTGRTDHFPWWFLPPLKDLLAVGVWAAAFLGNTIHWRGHRYQVHKGGKLTEL